MIALERLDAGALQGHWVLLNNVHLMPRWLRVLEKRIDEYAIKGTHEDFRIMLSRPQQQHPHRYLDRSIKLTSDPPSAKAEPQASICMLQ